MTDEEQAELVKMIAETFKEAVEGGVCTQAEFGSMAIILGDEILNGGKYLH